jgi:aryl-alcohol dehydrogenase-like predicted oxidoreductase
VEVAPARLLDLRCALAVRSGERVRLPRSSWILTRGDAIAPIPGTRRVARVEENTAADGIELSTEQLDRVNALEPAAGERHDESNMASIDR